MQETSEEIVDTLSDESSQTPLRHSGFGIASFFVSLLTIFFFLSLLGIFVSAIEGDRGSPETSAEYYTTMVGRLMATVVLAIPRLIGCLGGGIVGIGLGIAGMLQKNHRKVFSVLV